MGVFSVPGVANQCTSVTNKGKGKQLGLPVHSELVAFLWKPDSSNGLLPQRWLGQEEIGHSFLVWSGNFLRPGPGSLKPEAVSCPRASEFLLYSPPPPLQ